MVSKDLDAMTFVDLYRIPAKRRYMVFLLVAFAVVLAAVASFVMLEVCVARAVILPIRNQQPGMAGMKAVAAQFGVGTAVCPPP